MSTKTVKRAYRFRFYPTTEQENMLRRTLGCCRKVYNMALDARSTAWTLHREKVGYADDGAGCSPLGRKTEEHSYLKEVSSVPLQTNRYGICRPRSRGSSTKTGSYPRFKAKTRGRFRHLHRLRVHMGLGAQGVDAG